MLSVAKSSVGDCDIYRLKGAFDAYNAANFRSEVLEQVAMGRTRMILNMSEVDLIDSTGLGFLVSILKTVLKNKGKFYLVQLPSVIMEIFVMTKLDRVFTIFATEQEALDDCKG